MFSKSTLLTFSLAAAVLVNGQLTGIAKTAPTKTPTKVVGKLPALGWNSWNAYGCNVSAAKVLAAAQSFVSLGLKDAGYEYVNIDDCWPEQDRDPVTGRIVPDPTKFPDGISGLATQIHDLGLKIGIYSDAGTNTCADYPGSLGNEEIDATTFSEWGIDYLKYDNCYVPANWTDAAVPPENNWYNSNSAIRYRQMTAALDSVSRPIEFELCIWGQADVTEWGARVGHSWRIGGDANASWAYITSVLQNNNNLLSSIDFWSHNDMDMMEIGNGDLTIEEQRTHFAAWAFLKSPILLGTELSALTSTQLAIIKNPELLAYHQDPNIGGPAHPFTAYSGQPTTVFPEYYSGTSSQGIHVFIINTSSSTETKKFVFSNVPGLGKSGSFKVHDMWAGKDLAGTYAASSTFTVSVAPHDTVAYYISEA